MPLQLHPKAKKGVIVYTPSKRQKALRKLRNIGISVTVLVLLLGGAGFAYTWYFGDHGEQSKSLQTGVTLPKKTTTAPPVQARNVPIGVSISIMTTTVAPGDNASVSIRTAQNADCTISVVYDKVPSKDSGLKPKQADIYGFASWSWTVDATAPIGKWPVKVTCVRDKKSAVVEGDLVVTREKQP